MGYVCSYCKMLEEAKERFGGTCELTLARVCAFGINKDAEVVEPLGYL